MDLGHTSVMEAPAIQRRKAAITATKTGGVADWLASQWEITLGPTQVTRRQSREIEVDPETSALTEYAWEGQLWRVLQDQAMTTHGPLALEGLDRRQDNEAEDEGFRATEMAWLASHLEQLQHEFPGEWIAIDGDSLVAHALDMRALYEQAGAVGHPNPFVTAIPATPGGIVSL